MGQFADQRIHWKFFAFSLLLGATVLTSCRLKDAATSTKEAQESAADIVPVTVAPSKSIVLSIPRRAKIVGTPAKGNLAGNPPRLNYTAAADAFGSDVLYFTYKGKSHKVAITIQSDGLQPGLDTSVPQVLSYDQDSFAFEQGVQISPIQPSTDNLSRFFRAVPPLPEGILLDARSGVISGTPVAASSSQFYKIIGENTLGGVEISLSIKVAKNLLPPNGLKYNLNPVAYNVGVPAHANPVRLVSGVADTYSISPALPSGLNFSATTGVVTGAPTEPSGAQGYTVTATNSKGSTSITLTISVNAKNTISANSPSPEPSTTMTPSSTPSPGGAPSNLSYSHMTSKYTQKVGISENQPTLTGTATSWSIYPLLPAGLVFDPKTGILSGTPNVTATSSTYLVTALNLLGSTTAVLTIEVTNQKPSAVSYSSPTVKYGKGLAITPNTPTVSASGGSVSSYSVLPALPAGLLLDTTTGVISGIPTAIVAAKNYTIKATNPFGSVTTIVNIQIGQPPPQDFSYHVTSANYTKGTKITDNLPIVSGSGITYAMQTGSVLPAGLTLTASTGAISGKPTAVVEQKDYVIVATTSGGSVSTSISIEVNFLPPSNFSYLNNPATYIKGQPIETNMPVIGGGAASSFTVAPALPAGLALNATTGNITGTPTAVLESKKYVVTAKNATNISVSVDLYIRVDAPPADGLAVGQGHACAIVNAGVRCWGRNTWGQIGLDPATYALHSKAYTIPNLGVKASLNRPVTAITAGEGHTCAIANGAAWCWGKNNRGQLGDGTVVGRAAPALVKTLASGVLGIAAGANHTCALLSDGTVQCWGDNQFGQIGNGNYPTTAIWQPVYDASVVKSWTYVGAATAYYNQPVAVSGLSGASSLSAGRTQSCAIVSGSLYCWGKGSDHNVMSGTMTAKPGTGQMPYTSNPPEGWLCSYQPGTGNAYVPSCTFNGIDYRATPAVIASLSAVTAVSTSGETRCVIAGESAKCWGANSSGQVGNGTQAYLDSPLNACLSTAAKIASGAYHTCASTTEPLVYCWGDNSFSELGVSGGSSTTPVNTANIGAGAIGAIGVGDRFSCVIVGGKAKWWGQNNYGQMGVGKISTTLPSQSTPTPVLGLD